MSELKSCPFCGSKYPQTVVDDETEEKFGVKCFNCGGSIYPEKETLREAIEAWNRRTTIEPERQWIPCSERLPERIINGDVETEQEFLVTVKERWPGEEWTYDTDLAWVPGEYIDDYWQTFNDWKEGQEVHVIAWMPLPTPYQENADV